MQKTFGKNPSDLATMVDGFAHFLAGQPIAAVLRALEAYVLRHPDIPTPSDLMAIIEPPVEVWKPDWSFYQALKQMLRDGGDYALGRDEVEYIKECEKHSIRALHRHLNARDG